MSVGVDMKEQFYKMPKHLLRSAGYISSSGEYISLTDSDKNIYIVLKSRNEYFRMYGKSHYDTHEDISSMCNISLRKVGGTLREFHKNGIIDVRKTKRGNWVYEKIHPLTLWKGKKGEEVIIGSADIRLVQSDLEDDFDSPF